MLPRRRHHPRPPLPGERRLPQPPHQRCGGVLHPDPVRLLPLTEQRLLPLTERLLPCTDVTPPLQGAPVPGGPGEHLPGGHQEDHSGQGPGPGRGGGRGQTGPQRLQQPQLHQEVEEHRGPQGPSSLTDTDSPASQDLRLKQFQS